MPAYALMLSCYYYVQNYMGLIRRGLVGPLPQMYVQIHVPLLIYIFNSILLLSCFFCFSICHLFIVQLFMCIVMALIVAFTALIIVSLPWLPWNFLIPELQIDHCFWFCTLPLKRTTQSGQNVWQDYLD